MLYIHINIVIGKSWITKILIFIGVTRSCFLWNILPILASWILKTQKYERVFYQMFYVRSRYLEIKICRSSLYLLIQLSLKIRLHPPKSSANRWIFSSNQLIALEIHQYHPWPFLMHDIRQISMKINVPNHSHLLNLILD